MKNKELLEEIEKLKNETNQLKIETKNEIKHLKNEILNNTENIEKLLHEFLNCKQTQQQQESAFDTYRQNIRDRDYLIGTDFIGKLKNKKIIEEFLRFNKTRYSSFLRVHLIETRFHEVKEEIINYNFSNLKIFKEELEKHEKEQEILDKYQEENKKEKKENKQL